MKEGSEQFAETIKTNNISRRCVHDLYRFFKLWDLCAWNHDIFTDDLSLWKCEALKPVHAYSRKPETNSQLFIF